MNEQLSFNELRAYQAGKLTGSARHRVERLLLENPLYADALAGLEAMQQTATPTTEQLADLRTALHQRIHESATQKRLWPLWIATTTAAILFMLAMAIYFIFFAPKQPAKPKPQPKHVSANIGAGKPVYQLTVKPVSSNYTYTFGAEIQKKSCTFLQPA